MLTLNTSLAQSVQLSIFEPLWDTRCERPGKSFLSKDGSILLLEADGRKLTSIVSNSIDAIVTDHPWLNPESNEGGNRQFVDYHCFNYTLADFSEKYRVLKPGRFLCEFLPEESASNWEYLYRIKQLATEAGFEYYAKVPWKKGTFVSNTGRKAHQVEDVMFFTKGKPISWRRDSSYSAGVYMSGIRMLPAQFDAQPTPVTQRVQKSEKPVKLLEELLEYVTPEGGVILDQFAGSASTARACLAVKRDCICIELDRDRVEGAAKRLELMQFHNHK